MVFSSYEFLLVFLPVVVAGYFLLSRTRRSVWQKLFLLGGSLFFYGYFNVRYLLLILASIGVNYAAATMIQRTPERKKRLGKALLTAGVLFNVGLIGYYKYFDFFLETVNAVAGTEFILRNILLPLGISFFTFQQLSFLISVYKREEKVEDLLNYALFVTFFPQLVAGPIVLYEEMIPQFADDCKRRFNADNFARGLYFFGVGLLKKAVIADSLAVLVDNGFGIKDPGMVGAWATALCYTLQIYFDFSGYSDMAIGLGRMFNIELPDNFDRPYLSESITVFWRRWHMTLGRALSYYVYKPLGGNRKGMTRTCINLFLTFFVSGLWHGASWNFLVWGIAQGIIVIVERLCRNGLEKIPRWVRIAGTFLTTNFLWVLFRAESFEAASVIYRGMFDFENPGMNSLSLMMMDGTVAFPMLVNCACVFMVLAGLLTVVFSGREKIRLQKDQLLTRGQAWLAAACFVLALMCMGRESVFIYYNF